MLVTTTTEPIGCGSPASRTPSILDSPTLARVERARLRLEASSNQQLHQLHQLQHQQHQQHQNQLNHNTLRDGSLERNVHDSKKEVPWHQVWTHMKRLSNNSKVNSTNTLTTGKTHCSTPMKKFSMIPDNKTTSLSGSIFRQQVFYQPEMHSLLTGRIPVASMTGPIKRGLLWQQRDRLFSRWKERYFILTRDYLHCFKRASGSANERASDMGQFIFKVKLVDVEKVEWLNRRSYSAIGLLLGREGRVLLRCDDGLEDWFELLEECTLTSKERRRALKITQGPRSRASLAAPVSHASLQAHHFGLGGTYSSALDDWLMTNRGCGGLGGGVLGGGGAGGIGRHKIIGSGSICGGIGINPFLFSDSVPDLSALSNENHNHHLSGISTNHSTPQKIPYSSAAFNLNRYSNGHIISQNSSCGGVGGGGGGGVPLYGSPRRIFINSFGSNNIVDEEATEETEVQMRRPRAAAVFRNNNLNNNNNLNLENGNNELDRDWLYRKPRPPTDVRHSMQPTTDLDYSLNNDSGLDTPPSTHRPSSYRDASHASPRDSTETTVSSSRGTLLNNSPGGSFRAKHLNHVTNLNQVNALNGSRYSVQERILKIRNDEDRCSSIKSTNRMNHHHHHHHQHQQQQQQLQHHNLNYNQNNHNTTMNESSLYDPNQNRYCKHSPTTTTTLTTQRSPLSNATTITGSSLSNGNGNGGAGLLNGNFTATNLNGSAIFRERYQHPALAAIINESQGLKFRDRSYSDCQKGPPRRTINNNPSPTSRRLPIFGTPTRI